MIVFKNGKLVLEVKDVRLPNGETINFARITRRPGTNIIPFIDKDTILMNYQYRPAVKKWIYQLPGGTVEKGETPLENAFKELEEELGYRASKMEIVGGVYTAPHITDDFQYILVAKGLKKTRRHLEKGELIKMRRIKIKDAIKMAYKGKILDATTVIGLLMLKGR
jgi:ADP-ribose pyrophosphatase